MTDMTQKQVKIFGYLGSLLSIVMYSSYVFAIIDNLHGHPSSFIQPLAAFFNSLVWTLYGLLSKPRDWPIVIANAPGVFICSTAFVTALIH